MKQILGKLSGRAALIVSLFLLSILAISAMRRLWIIWRWEPTSGRRLSVVISKAHLAAFYRHELTDELHTGREPDFDIGGAGFRVEAYVALGRVLAWHLDFRVPAWFLVLLSVAPTTLKIARMWSSRRQLGSHSCVGCGYNLTGNVSGVCPECGTSIGDRDRHSQEKVSG